MWLNLLSIWILLLGQSQVKNQRDIIDWNYIEQHAKWLYQEGFCTWILF